MRGEPLPFRHRIYIYMWCTYNIPIRVCSHKLYGGREPRRFYHKIILISQEQQKLVCIFVTTIIIAKGPRCISSRTYTYLVYINLHTYKSHSLMCPLNIPVYVYIIQKILKIMRLNYEYNGRFSCTSSPKFRYTHDA